MMRKFGVTLLGLGVLCCASPGAEGQTPGGVVAWGSHVLIPDRELVGIAAVSVGDDHTLLLKPDGSIVAFGDNGSGQCNVPAPNSGFIAVSAGGSHSLALRANGSIVGWGSNWDGQLNVPAPN